MLQLILFGHQASLSLSNGLLTLWLEIMSIIRTQFIYLEIAMVLITSLWCVIHMCSQSIDF